MCGKFETRFIEFVSELSGKICLLLKPYYPEQAIDGFSAEFPRTGMKSVISEVTRDWSTYAYRAGVFGDYDDMVTIFMINLIGHLNRVPLPRVVKRPKFNYVFLSMMERILGNEIMRERFVRVSEPLMEARAA